MAITTYGDESKSLIVVNAAFSSVASITSPSWTANLLKEVEFVLVTDTNPTSCVCTLGSVVGTYGSQILFGNGASAGGVAHTTTWDLNLVAANSSAIGKILIPQTSQKYIHSTSWSSATSALITGVVTDSSNSPTSLTFTFGGACSGSWIVRGRT